MQSNLITYDDRWRGGIDWNKTLIAHAQAAKHSEIFSNATSVVDEANPYMPSYWAEDAVPRTNRGVPIGSEGYLHNFETASAQRTAQQARKRRDREMGGQRMGKGDPTGGGRSRRTGRVAGAGRMAGKVAGAFGAGARAVGRGALFMGPESVRRADIRGSWDAGIAQGRASMGFAGARHGQNLFGGYQNSAAVYNQAGGMAPKAPWQRGYTQRYRGNPGADNWTVGRGLERGAYGAGYGVGVGQRMGQIGRGGISHELAMRRRQGTAGYLRNAPIRAAQSAWGGTKTAAGGIRNAFNNRGELGSYLAGSAPGRAINSARGGLGRAWNDFTGAYSEVGLR